VSDDDSTYHFDPDEFREGEPPGTADGVEAGEERSVTGRTGESTVTPPSRSDSPHGGDEREFDWRGWILVAMLFVALVVVPTLLYFVPRAQGLAGSIGLGYRDAFLVLPLVPAVVLALLAVWATTRP
jgi:hypothetical protein